MKILLVTMDMLPGTEHLMPWKTLIEVAGRINKREGINVASIYSGDYSYTNDYRQFNGLNIYSGSKGNDEICTYIKRENFDAVFFPIAFRDVFKSFNSFKNIRCRKIAYIPGGLYPVDGIVKLIKTQGLNSSRSYLLEKIIPHSIMVKKLKDAGFSDIITFSESTRRNLLDCGMSDLNCHCTIPGIDGYNALSPDFSKLESMGLGNRKFLLFAGAPATVRGSQLLLKAYNKFVKKSHDTTLVMLMRTDRSSDFTTFENVYEAIPDKTHLIVSYDKLTPSQLKAFFTKAHAVVLPFILIPSEIPLTFFEVLSCGTPFVTFENEGTTDCIKGMGYIASRRSSSTLAKAMMEACSDIQLYDNIKTRIKNFIEDSPSWDKMTDIWQKLANGRNA